MKMKATKRALRQEIAELRQVGAQMANVFFNWSQGRQMLDQDDRDMMQLLRLEWDAIRRAEVITRGDQGGAKS